MSRGPGEPADGRQAVDETSGIAGFAIEADRSAESGTTRTTLRLPEHLKQQVEEAAARQGLSVNSWLIRAISQALRSESPERRSGLADPGGQSYTGWAR